MRGIIHCMALGLLAAAVAAIPADVYAYPAPGSSGGGESPGGGRDRGGRGGTEYFGPGGSSYDPSGSGGGSSGGYWRGGVYHTFGEDAGGAPDALAGDASSSDTATAELEVVVGVTQGCRSAGRDGAGSWWWLPVSALAMGALGARRRRRMRSTGVRET